MTATIDLTDSIARTVLRSFLLDVLPSGVEVVRGQDNRVGEPQGVDFVTMTPIMRTRLATTLDAYHDGYPSTPGTRSGQASTDWTVQLDVHGPNSSDNAQIISTLFRDSYGYEQFTASGYAIAPLYTDDPRQVPFIDGEDQYEDRWIVDAHVQINPIVTTPQQFAGTLAATIYQADGGNIPWVITGGGQLLTGTGSTLTLPNGSVLVLGTTRVGSPGAQPLGYGATAVGTGVEWFVSGGLELTDAAGNVLTLPTGMPITTAFVRTVTVE